MSFIGPTPDYTRHGLRELIFSAIVNQSFVDGAYRVKMKRAGHSFYISKAGKQEADGAVTVHLSGQNTESLDPVAINGEETNIELLMKWTVEVRALFRIKSTEQIDSTSYKVGDWLSGLLLQRFAGDGWVAADGIKEFTILSVPRPLPNQEAPDDYYEQVVIAQFQSFWAPVLRNAVR